MVTVPMMTVVAVAGFSDSNASSFSLIPSAEAAQGEAEGEAEGTSASLKEAVSRPQGYTPYQGNVASLAAQGEKLFNDTTLSSNGLSCATCHADGAGYSASFKNDYPHPVAMAQRDFDKDEVYLDEMVQICMVAPMAAEPLDWDGEQLASLTEFMRQEQEKITGQ